MKKEHIILISIFLLSFLVKFLFLMQYPHIPGRNSGYYVWHANDVLEGEFFSTTDAPFVFFLSAFLSLIVGDTVLAVKIVIALLSSLYVIPFYLIVKELSGKEELGIFAGLIGTFAGQNWWIACGHVKNIAGLFFGLFVIYFFIKSLKSLTPKNAGLLTLSLVLMVASHFSSSAYIVAAIGASAFAILVWLLYKKEANEHAIKTCAIIILVSFICASVVLLFKPELIGDSSIGTIGVEEKAFGPRGGIDLSILGIYNVLFLLSLAGLYLLWERKELFILFSLFVFVSFILTQSAFVDDSWTTRFEKMSFIPFTILGFYGISYFKNRIITYGLMVLVVLLVAHGFLGSYNRPAMILSSEDYLELVAFYENAPEMTVYSPDDEYGLGKDERYWLNAIGFDAIDEMPEPPFGENDFLVVKTKNLPKESIEVGSYAFVPLEDDLPIENLKQKPEEFRKGPIPKKL